MIRFINKNYIYIIISAHSNCNNYNDYFGSIRRYIYDNKGVEIHCLKNHERPYRLDFLPYHFLLASVGHSGWIKWQDFSTGTYVYFTLFKRLCIYASKLKSNRQIMKMKIIYIFPIRSQVTALDTGLVK